MVFADIFGRVAEQRRQLTFYNVEDHAEAVEIIIEYVGAHDVEIEYATDETLSGPTVIVSHGDDELATDDVETVADYITAWESELTGGEELPSLFGALDETVFRSTNKHQLVLASRLVENRAATVGHGRVSAGFQQLSFSKPQLDFYRQLPDDVTVSLYGEADWTPPADSGIQAYEPARDDHIDYWWVIYDGTDQPTHHGRTDRRRGRPQRVHRILDLPRADRYRDAGGRRLAGRASGRWQLSPRHADGVAIRSEFSAASPDRSCVRSSRGGTRPRRRVRHPPRRAGCHLSCTVGSSRRRSGGVPGPLSSRGRGS